MEFHPIADIFPLMEGEAFEGFCRDIKENGLKEPVIIHEGKILDGRNRYRGCEKVGVPVRTECYLGDDPLGYVVSLNLHRRHLSESQRAMVAARIATMKRGNQPANASIDALGQPEAAALLNVSRESVQRAAKVQREASPEIIAAVEKGEVTVSAAATAVDAMEEYPFLQSPHWSPVAMAQAKRALDKLDEGEKPVVAELIREANADTKLGVQIAEKVAGASPKERDDFFRLAGSEDERERDAAATWAMNRDPMPDPRLMVFRKIIQDYRGILRRFPAEPQGVTVNRCIALTEQMIEEIKSTRKEITLGADDD